jgi:hypothetical protein
VAFFCVFPNINYENTLLVDDMLYKSLFNLPVSAIFLEMFYKSRTNGDYLFGTVLPYLEALHSSRMQVCKFVECNPSERIKHILLFNL